MRWWEILWFWRASKDDIHLPSQGSLDYVAW
jgi:hypothetical protein